MRVERSLPLDYVDYTPCNQLPITDTTFLEEGDGMRYMETIAATC